MATGSLSGSTCYESLASATDAYFSSYPISSSVDSAGVVHVAQYIKPYSYWYFQQSTIDASGNVIITSSVAAPVQIFPPCDAPSEYFNLGLTYGAGLVAVLLAAWVFVVVQKVLK